MVNKSTVRKTLLNHGWTFYIKGGIYGGCYAELWELWDALAELVLQHSIEHSYVRRLSTCGQYSTKSAYWLTSTPNICSDGCKPIFPVPLSSANVKGRKNRELHKCLLKNHHCK
jgi:hypothetical protein